MFFVQLASLIEAGLALDRCLEMLGNQKYRGHFSKIIKTLLADIRSGVALSDAMGKQRSIFSELQVQMAHAGEVSGHLELILAKLAEYLEKEEARKSQLKSALIYPIFLISLALGATGFIIAFVIPKMTKVFESFGTKLPWTTRLLLGMGQFTSNYWVLLLLIIIAGIIGVKFYIGTPEGQLNIDRLILKIPVIGPLALKVSLARFTRTMAVLGGGGVGVIESLEIAAAVSGNRVVKNAVLEACPEVREGEQLAAIFVKQGIFPEMLTNMMAVGEETGNLEKMFFKVTEMYEFEVDAGLKRLLSLLEPSLIVVMGLVVAFIVISVLVPIMNVGSDF
jgi:type II secretory pathway component PulF